MDNNAKTMLKYTLVSIAGICGFTINGVYFDTRLMKEENTQLRAYGYVAKEDFKYKNLNFNGKPVAILNVKGNEYLFKYVDGKPTLLEFEVTPKKLNIRNNLESRTATGTGQNVMP